jgi:signal recognition particle subunit SRP19
MPAGVLPCSISSGATEAGKRGSCIAGTLVRLGGWCQAISEKQLRRSPRISGHATFPGAFVESLVDIRSTAIVAVPDPLTDSVRVLIPHPNTTLPQAATMSHARIEEVSDSDPEIDDPSEFLPYTDNQIIRPAGQPSSQPSKPPSAPNPTLFRPPPPSEPQFSRQAPAEVKHYQCIYPIYFDSTRSKSQGRRVSKHLAIPNPLAWQVLCAIRFSIGEDVLRMVFEPDKTHPKDWANPGRIKVQLKDYEDGNRPVLGTIKCKAHLYNVIGKWLVEHPTTKETPLELKLPGLPVPEKFLETDVVKPRGWKMGTILPVHSDAVSGGGVKDDFFKEAMEEMRAAQAQGQLPGGGPGGGGGMPDMAALQNMMQGMGGMGGLGGLMGGGGGGGAGESSGGKKKKDKKKG